MPTLFRFLVWCAIAAGTVYAILLALAYGVEPAQREGYVKIPSERINPPAVPAAPPGNGK